MLADVLPFDASSNEPSEDPPHVLESKTTSEASGKLASTESFSNNDGDDDLQTDFQTYVDLLEVCLNNMFNTLGRGPFITIAFLFTVDDPHGPQWLIGYAVGAFICLNDSLIWAELSSTTIERHGSLSYLRECYGRETVGRLMSWLYVWQLFFSGPLEIASGFVAMAHYLAYITEVEEDIFHNLIAATFCVVSFNVLWLKRNETHVLWIFLWAASVGAVVFVILTGFFDFERDYMTIPKDAFESKFALGIGVAARISMYDLTGYSDVCQKVHAIAEPRRVLPIACIVICCALIVLQIMVCTAVGGVLPWTSYAAIAGPDADSANFVMSLYAEEVAGSGFAIFFTLVVLLLIFGCFLKVVGCVARVPHDAAKEGLFLSWFGAGRLTPEGLPLRSLAVMGTFATACCFLQLEVLIKGMLTTKLVVQYVGQAVGVIIYRSSHPEVDRRFRVPLFPLPNITCILGFIFVLATTENWLLCGLSFLFLFLGGVLYFPWARACGDWPFDKYAPSTPSGILLEPNNRVNAEDTDDTEDTAEHRPLSETIHEEANQVKCVDDCVDPADISVEEHSDYNLDMDTVIIDAAPSSEDLVVDSSDDARAERSDFCSVLPA